MTAQQTYMAVNDHTGVTPDVQKNFADATRGPGCEIIQSTIRKLHPVVVVIVSLITIGVGLVLFGLFGGKWFGNGAAAFTVLYFC